MILMNDFKREPEDLRQAMASAVNEVLGSGWFILGAQLERFETAWAQRCQVAHGVGLGNGMDAIELALRGLGIGPGDEVVTTSMTAFATVLAVIRAGATPVLADIDADTALLSMASVGRCINDRTKAVILVHLYGQAHAVDEWARFCKHHGVALVEDCAQSHDARWSGQSCGTFGVAGAFSFYPTKNLGALGDAGMLVTHDDGLATAVRQLRNYGQRERYHHAVLGMNSRLDEMQAAILLERMKWLIPFTERRRAIAARYLDGIRHPDFELLARPAQADAHVYHLFVVRSTRRDAAVAHLQACGVQSHIHYPVPVHKQAPCLQIGRDPLGLPVTERHADMCLSLPCHPQMTDEEVTQVISAVNSF